MASLHASAPQDAALLSPKSRVSSRQQHPPGPFRPSPLPPLRTPPRTANPATVFSSFPAPHQRRPRSATLRLVWQSELPFFLPPNCLCVVPAQAWLTFFFRRIPLGSPNVLPRFGPVSNAFFLAAPKRAGPPRGQPGWTILCRRPASPLIGAAAPILVPVLSLPPCGPSLRFLTVSLPRTGLFHRLSGREPVWGDAPMRTANVPPPPLAEGCPLKTVPLRPNLPGAPCLAPPLRRPLHSALVWPTPKISPRISPITPRKKRATNPPP